MQATSCPGLSLPLYQWGWRAGASLAAARCPPTVSKEILGKAGRWALEILFSCYISSGCCDTCHRLGLKQQTLICSQLWKLGVWIRVLA